MGEGGKSGKNGHEKREELLSPGEKYTCWPSS